MLKPEEYKEISELLFPNVSEVPEDIYAKYPKRDLKEDQFVTRFAPSPTGFLHMGGIFASLIPFKIAKQSNGVFILRIEDTDKGREVENGIKFIFEGLSELGIVPDEGAFSKDKQVGEYGPYIQSERLGIYHVFAKQLILEGRAYPCFATAEELEDTRNKQKELGVKTGYYGEWAKWRDASMEDIKEELEKGSKFVIRIRSNGGGEEEFVYTDLIKGKKSLKKNSIDAVLIKSDGFPVYHFAHPIDDTLMDMTYVIRAEEWFASVPLHFEIFEALGMKVLPYAHIPTVMKLDDGKKRKLSKRKDPEADVRFYNEQGYPKEGVLEYLINIINSNYQDWKRANPSVSYDDFKVSLEKVNRSGALFDLKKLEDFCKDFVASLSAEEVYEKVLDWSSKYDKEVYGRLKENRELAIKIFNIERRGEKIRKDIAKWSDVKGQLNIFFDDLFNTLEVPVLPENISEEDVEKIVELFLKSYDPSDDGSVWFDKIKEIGTVLGFTFDYKAFKEDPSQFKGKVGDIAMVLRLKVARKAQTPDISQVMQVLGKEKVEERLRS